MVKWSAAKENLVAEKLSAGIAKTAIEYANRNPGDADAQRLANDLSNMLQTYRRTGEVPD